MYVCDDNAMMGVLFSMFSMVLQAGDYYKEDRCLRSGYLVRKVGSFATVKQGHMSYDRTYPYSPKEVYPSVPSLA